MKFNYKILFLCLLLPLLSSFKSPPLQEKDILGLWIIDKVHCLGGKVLSVGMESELSYEQMAQYQKQVEQRYQAQTTYEFKKDGTFIANQQTDKDAQEDYSWVGKWEFIDQNKIKLIGFSSECEDCNQFFEVIDFSESQISLMNQFVCNTENSLFSLSNAVIKFAITLVK